MPVLVHPLLQRLFAALDAAGVRWCLLRGEGQLAAPEGDVDLLVDADDLDAAEDVFFALDGIALPRDLHPWHRFYLLRDASERRRLKLDVVTALVYSRALRLRSGLESACLARRSRGAVRRLDATDEFWTLVLHCALDKGAVNARRAAELEALVDQVARPSAGERFVASISPPGWSVERLLTVVRRHDWAGVARFGQDVVAALGGAQPPQASTRRRGVALLSGATAEPRLVLRSAARRSYLLLWRRAGLGALPRAVEVAEHSQVDALVVRLVRRPLLRQVAVLVLDDTGVGVLQQRLRSDGYRRSGRSWWRATASGVERVDVVAASQWLPSAAVARAMFCAAHALPSHSHCRRPLAAHAVLLGGLAATAGSSALALRLPSGADVSPAARSQAWSFAKEHGLTAAVGAAPSGGTAT